MKADTLQILWHPDKSNKGQAVYALDINQANVLATAGADEMVRLWQINGDKVEFITELSGHDRTVNVVRFSPDGTRLASAGDDSVILVRTRRSSDNWTEWSLNWLRGHVLDVCDLCWSPDGLQLASASVDNVVLVWKLDSSERKEMKRHENYVQGVAWDPRDEFVASQSSDQTCAVLHKQSEQASSWTTHRTLQQITDGTESRDMFCDQDTPLFFRRLCWSPEGSLLLCPAGVHQSHKQTEAVPEMFQTTEAAAASGVAAYSAYVIGRKNLGEPLLQLAGFNKPVTAIRCCPVLFQRIASTEPAALDLPYRIVFAVMSLDVIRIYDTQHKHPICHIGGLHYAHLTDIGWVHDGSKLMVSSADGYCSLISFEAGELGELLPEEQVPALMRQRKALDCTASTVGVTEKRAAVNVLAPRTKKAKRIVPSVVESAGHSAAVVHETAAENKQSSLQPPVQVAHILKPKKKITPERIQTSITSIGDPTTVAQPSAADTPSEKGNKRKIVPEQLPYEAITPQHPARSADSSAVNFEDTAKRLNREAAAAAPRVDAIEMATNQTSTV